MTYELIVIGGGPAGVAAGIYAARKKIHSAIITDFFGGQSVVSTDIQNWIGTSSVSGQDLSGMLEKHLRTQEGIDIYDGEKVSSISRVDASISDAQFHVATESGQIFNTKTIFLGVGSRRRKLGVPGEKEFDGRGVAYCATCDAPLFQGKTVAVIGGGNAGLEAALDLSHYASRVYLLHRNPALKGDPATQERIASLVNVSFILNAETREVFGDTWVKGLRYFDKTTQEIKELPLDGVFVEIGFIPNSDLVKDLVFLNRFGEVVVDHKTQRTSLHGIWAAGDVSDVIYKQNNISAGDAIKAVLNIYEYLRGLPTKI